MNVLYININGLYGIREKDREKLRNCVDVEYCRKNAKSICDRILDSQNIEKSLKYDIVFFSEFAPNTPAGKQMTDCFDKMGYRLILPNAYDSLEDVKGKYSIVVAYVRKDLHITKSKPSPQRWLTWCEISVNDQTIVGIHNARDPFLFDVKEEMKAWKETKEKLIILGDTNVTQQSEIRQIKLMNGMISIVGSEIFDTDKKNTYREVTKPDRVFSNTDIEFFVMDGFFKDKLSDHDALSVTIK